MLKKILVIDDEENIRELIKFNLETAGYKVELAADGQQGLDKLNNSIDLVVLDLMLPIIDGLSVCRTIRGNEDYQQLPIIMLTAKGGEVDRILGLEMGADDYLTKPFSPRELVARIKAVLRRFNAEEKNGMEKRFDQSVISIGELELDSNSHEVRIAGNLMDLTPKEFDLLRLLLLNTGRVLTRDMLLEKIWGYEYAGDTRTVDVHIRRLRTKVGKDYIKTVRGVGYKFAKLE
ncbi:MAG: response regulator transcription factor [Halanaerobiales bacterium]|nr:response regulator transcription factor [Halanaerobiales bacterium]